MHDVLSAWSRFAVSRSKRDRNKTKKEGVGGHVTPIMGNEVHAKSYRARLLSFKDHPECDEMRTEEENRF